jgi:hypothetical protein
MNSKISRPAPSFPSDLDGTIGMMVCWTLTGTVDPADLDAACIAHGLPAASDNLLPIPPAAAFGCAMRNLSDRNGWQVRVVGPHKRDGRTSYSVLLGRKVEHEDVSTRIVGHAHIVNETEEMTGTFTPDANDEERAMLASILREAGDEYRRLVHRYDCGRIRNFITRSLLDAHAVPTTPGNWFVPHDASPGAESPARMAEAVRDVVQAAMPGARVYAIPVFPSGDATRFSREAAEAAMVTRMREVHEKLSAMSGFSNGSQGAHWLAEIDALEAEASLYERILSARADQLAQVREEARKRVKELAGEYEAMLAQAKAARTSVRALRASADDS